MASWFTLTLLMASQGTVDTKPLRLIPFVTPKSASELELRVENPSTSPLDADLGAELVLWVPRPLPARNLVDLEVTYRARMDLRGANAVSTDGQTQVKVSAEGWRVWATDPAVLLWCERVGTSRGAVGSLRQVVPPGHYDLTFWLERGDPPWWQSRPLHVTVDGRGRFSIQAPEPR